LRSYLEETVAAPVYKTENTAVGIRSADHATPSIRKKLALTSPIRGGRSVGIVRLRTKATEFFYTSYAVIGITLTTQPDPCNSHGAPYKTKRLIKPNLTLTFYNSEWVYVL
jgi:hypothetical protein